MDARRGRTLKNHAEGPKPHAEGQILYASIHMWHLVKPQGQHRGLGAGWDECLVGAGGQSGKMLSSGDGGGDGNTAPQTCLVPSSLKRVKMDTLMPHIFYQNFKK